MSNKARAMKHIAEKMANNVPAARNFMYHNSLVHVASSLSRAAEALAEMYRAPNPFDTQAAHDRRVADTSKKLDKMAADAVDKLNEIAIEGHRDLGRRITDLSKLRPGQFDQEIRSLFRMKSQSEQIAQLNAAVQDEDSEVLSALLTAPTAVSGLTKEMAVRYRDTYELKMAPVEYEERAQLASSINDTLTVISTAKSAAKEFFNPEAMRAAEAQAAQSAAALEAFNKEVAGNV